MVISIRNIQGQVVLRESINNNIAEIEIPGAADLYVFDVIDGLGDCKTNKVRKQ